MTPQDQPPAPTESALRYAIALCNGRLDVEAPYHAAIIAGYVATLERLLQPPPDPPAPTLRALIDGAETWLAEQAQQDKWDRSIITENLVRRLLVALLTETVRREAD
jgi:hypothetical protein